MERAMGSGYASADDSGWAELMQIAHGETSVRARAAEIDDCRADGCGALRHAVVDGEPVPLVHEVQRVNARRLAWLLTGIERIEERQAATRGQRHRSIATATGAYTRL